MATEMNRTKADAHPAFSDKQGQYLAFIYAYTIVLGRPPAEADLQRHFRVTPPSVHQMIPSLSEKASSAAHREPRAPSGSQRPSRHPANPEALRRSNRQIHRAEPL